MPRLKKKEIIERILNIVKNIPEEKYKQFLFDNHFELLSSCNIKTLYKYRSEKLPKYIIKTIKNIKKEDRSKSFKKIYNNIPLEEITVIKKYNIEIKEKIIDPPKLPIEKEKVVKKYKIVKYNHKGPILPIEKEKVIKKYKIVTKNYLEYVEGMRKKIIDVENKKKIKSFVNNIIDKCSKKYIESKKDKKTKIIKETKIISFEEIYKSKPKDKYFKKKINLVNTLGTLYLLMKPKNLENNKDICEDIFTEETLNILEKNFLKKEELIIDDNDIMSEGEIDEDEQKEIIYDIEDKINTLNDIEKHYMKITNDAIRTLKGKKLKKGLEELKEDYKKAVKEMIKEIEKLNNKLNDYQDLMDLKFYKVKHRTAKQYIDTYLNYIKDIKELRQNIKKMK